VEIDKVISPDGRAFAILTLREKVGPQYPGPEPRTVQHRWIRLVVINDGTKCYDSDFEDVEINQSISDGFDLAWSPDSAHVMYRSINKLRAIAKNGNTRSFAVVNGNCQVSSFKWINNNELLVLSKEPKDPLLYPKIYYTRWKQSGIGVSRLYLDMGITMRFSQDVHEPNFICRSIGWQNQEFSPNSNRLAFSDGSHLCIYDDALGRIIATVPLEGDLWGVWWFDDNTVVVIWDLPNLDHRFAVWHIGNDALEDKTAILDSAWNGRFDNPNWFRTVLK
jgi:hypothetical protein